MAAIGARLHYFAIPGRGEPARLMFTLGKVPDWQDVRHEFSAWPAVKGTMPFGQVPVLELPGGRRLAQTGAINRYVAKLAGFYPADPIDAAFAEQASFLVNDASDTFGPTFAIKDPEAKAQARRDLLQPGGKTALALEQLQKLVVESGDYVVGDKLSFADVEAFCYLSNLVSGFFDGVPKDALTQFPGLKAYRNRVASLPDVAAYYEDRAEGTYYAAFKPDA